MAVSTDPTASSVSLQLYAFPPLRDIPGGAKPATPLPGGAERESGAAEDRFTRGTTPPENAYPDFRPMPQGAGPREGEKEEPRTAEEALAAKGRDGEPLTEEEQRRLEELKESERKVKAHEQAHLAAGAGLVRGGAEYTYKMGPDGRLYAVSGEVTIDTSEGRTPEETIRKMERVKRAAMAPANPSGKDRQVAAEAARKQAEARAELARENAEENKQDASGAQGVEAPTPTPQGAAGAYEQTIAAGSGTLHANGSVLDIFM